MFSVSGTILATHCPAWKQAPLLKTHPSSQVQECDWPSPWELGEGCAGGTGIQAERDEVK